MLCRAVGNDGPRPNLEVLSGNYQPFTWRWEDRLMKALIKENTNLLIYISIMTIGIITYFLFV